METPKPSWLRRRFSADGVSPKVRSIIQAGGLNTVCAEAHCPNQCECFGRGMATFLLLGPACTRRCTFCAVDKSAVQTVDVEEPARIGRAVARLGLDFCVLTMVTRDDLPDGGAAHVARTAAAIRREAPGIRIELLISDLAANWDALETVLCSRPEVLNHNMETVPRLYQSVRPGADYGRSLELISRSSAHVSHPVTKSGIMLGLGETREEVLSVLADLRQAGCSLLTLGQYLAPSDKHHPVIRYVPPEEFAAYQEQALAIGFRAVASSPLVRSSYQASRLYEAGRACVETDRPKTERSQNGSYSYR